MMRTLDEEEEDPPSYSMITQDPSGEFVTQSDRNLRPTLHTTDEEEGDDDAVPPVVGQQRQQRQQPVTTPSPPASGTSPPGQHAVSPVVGIVLEDFSPAGAGPLPPPPPLPPAATNTRRTTSGSSLPYPVATIVNSIRTNVFGSNGAAPESGAGPVMVTDEHDEGPTSLSVRSDFAVGELDEDNIPSVRTTTTGQNVLVVDSNMVQDVSMLEVPQPRRSPWPPAPQPAPQPAASRADGTLRASAPKRMQGPPVLENVPDLRRAATSSDVAKGKRSSDMKQKSKQQQPASAKKGGKGSRGGFGLKKLFGLGRSKDKKKSPSSQKASKPLTSSMTSEPSEPFPGSGRGMASPSAPAMPLPQNLQHESTLGTSNVASAGVRRSNNTQYIQPVVEHHQSSQQSMDDGSGSGGGMRESLRSLDSDPYSTRSLGLGLALGEMNSVSYTSGLPGSARSGEESLIALELTSAAAARAGLGPSVGPAPGTAGHYSPYHQQSSPATAATGSAATASRQSVVASFMGTADQVGAAGVSDVPQEAGVLPAEYAYLDAVDYNEKDPLDYFIPESELSNQNNNDYKVDKGVTVDVEDMMRRAYIETRADLADDDENDDYVQVVEKQQHGPPLKMSSYGQLPEDSVPLSQAGKGDETVHNDTLKVVLVAAPGINKSWLAKAIRESSSKKNKKPVTLRVDVQTWEPDSVDVRCTLWDIQGALQDEKTANFGAHPGTQSLFFSSRSLYLLVWDLAHTNEKTMRYEPRAAADSDNDDSDSDEDEEDDFAREEINRQADRALYIDIQNRVLSWVDFIARSARNSAILPIVVIPDDMKEGEAKRRCDMMQGLLEEHVRQFDGARDNIPMLLTGVDNNILCVDHESRAGVSQVQEMILAIAMDPSKSVFDHIQSAVPTGTVAVLEVVRRIKKDHKFILIDYFLGELGSKLMVEEVCTALHFLSSVGEVLYFGTGDESVLSQYVIMDRKWLISALQSILRNNLKPEVQEARKFMQIQCIYGDKKFAESEITKTLTGGTNSNCPLLSDSDAQMLWQSMSFMREAADRGSEMTETSTNSPSMFYFLERLLVHVGIFLPLGAAELAPEEGEVFFVPSLLTQNTSPDVWTYKSSESYLTTLCHTWLFRDGVPFSLMEYISVRLLKDLYDFSSSFSSNAPHLERPERISRAQTLPIGRQSRLDVMEEYEHETMGRIRIHHLMCWKTSILVKIGTMFTDPDTRELRESFVEVFVSIVDQTSSQCVASDSMRAGMQRVVVSGKGQVGKEGHKLWQGGYKVVLDSVRATLDGIANIDFQVVCPECLAHSSPFSACTWSWDSVFSVAESGSSIVRCMRGHRVNSHLVCGTTREQIHQPVKETPSTLKVPKIEPVTDIFPSVVLVAVYNNEAKEIQSVGSGVLVDKKYGLIVTAGHCLFQMEPGSGFGARYFGIPNASVLIGVLRPDSNHVAVWRYIGDCIADDIHNVDAACVRITHRFRQDVDSGGSGIAGQAMDPVTDMAAEELKQRKLTSAFEIEEHIRVLGFNQSGEGKFQRGKKVDRTVDFANGYVVKRNQPSADDGSESSSSSAEMTFTPREGEIVTICPTIPGHSGGPCVSDEGKVIGVLSRADPVDRQRCYIVPGSECKRLVKKARQEIQARGR